jgi:hypothetical protein
VEGKMFRDYLHLFSISLNAAIYISNSHQTYNSKPSFRHEANTVTTPGRKALARRPFLSVLRTLIVFNFFCETAVK